MTTPPDDPRPGSVSIPGLDVYDTIGHGGFSVVYRARQRSMNREVAVKVINTGFTTDAERRRFERECHALGQLSHHPNIVTVFNDAMSTDGRPCIVMELYETNLRDRLAADGPLTAHEVLSVGVRVCGALQTAHDAGVLHRDLKPHNIFVSVYGEPALGDFGISTIDAERSQSALHGMSIAYAAPEVLDDGTVDARSDVYSLGATMYQLLTGAAPFASPEMSTTLRRILTEPPPPIDLPGTPSSVDAVIASALAKHPGERPPTASAFADAIRVVQAECGWDQTPIPRIARRGDSARPLWSPPVAPASSSEPARDDQTVRREGRAPPSRSEPPAPPSRRWRVVVGAAAAVAVAVGAIVVLVIASAGGDEPTDSTSPPASSPESSPATVAPMLQNVRIERADSWYEVHFQKTGDVASVRVQVTKPARLGDERTTVTESPAPIVTDAPEVCVELTPLDVGERPLGDPIEACNTGS